MVRRKVTKSGHPLETGAGRATGPRLVAQRNGRLLASFAEISGLGTKYLTRVVDALDGYTASLAIDTARARAVATRDFLAFVASASTREATQVRAALRAYDTSALDTTTAHSVELAFRDQLRGTYRPGSPTLASHIGLTNQALSCLASRALWPHTLRLPIERQNPDEIDVRASLLEAIGTDTNRVRDLRGEDARREAALRGVERLELPMPKSDAEFSVAVLRGERECLERLKSAARTVFDRSYAAWGEMRPRIAAAHDADHGSLEAWLADAVDLTDRRKRDHRFELHTTVRRR